MIIAIEGVSCTGKSTLAARLATRLGWQTIECYYHVANDRRRAYCKPH
ncbi:(d)CMP kinase [Sphaerisporangium perillae]|nr:(d)CMP kinase [Sphaerisporangium perillae]